MSSTPVFTSSESQSRWRRHMKDNYTINHEFSPCVFQVPDNLKETNPEAYTPQLLGLGAYHHFRPQVQPMENKKRAALLRTLKDLNFKEFIDLSMKFPDNFETTIRSCYDSYLDLEKETLAWVFLVDCLYLSDLMGQWKHGVEQEGNEALYAELFMLENQIPIVLIQESFKTVFLFVDAKSEVDYEEKIFSRCKDFSKKWSPLKLTENEGMQKEAYDTKKHLLHYMYQMIVKTKRDNNNNNPEETNQDNNSSNNYNNNLGGWVREAASQGGEIIWEAIEVFNSALSDAKSDGIKVPGNVDTVSNILRNIQKVLDHNLKNRDQIDIPSASRLKAILKITFTPCCGIGDIIFTGNIVYLPVITLRRSSEVILRNLAAYEQIAKKQESNPIRAYLELMGGLVKSEKDVELLKGEKIIEVEQLSNEDIVRMFDGFKKSDKRPDEESNNKVHKTIKGVKEEFGKVRIVKGCRSIMKGIAGCVNFCKPFFPLVVVLFLCFQTFCEIHGCRRRGTSYGGAALHGELDPNARLMLPRKVYRY